MSLSQIYMLFATSLYQLFGTNRYRKRFHPNQTLNLSNFLPWEDLTLPGIPSHITLNNLNDLHHLTTHHNSFPQLYHLDFWNTFFGIPEQYSFNFFLSLDFKFRVISIIIAHTESTLIRSVCLVHSLYNFSCSSSKCSSSSYSYISCLLCNAL